MTSIILFQFEQSKIRTGEVEGKAVFCLTDLLLSMESKTESAKAKASIEEVFGDGVVIELPIFDSLGREQTALFVFESGATFLISRSRTEKGKRLNRWIHSEVLPSIRKTGSYSAPKPQTELERAKAYVVALEAKAELEIINSQLVEENQQLSEAVDELFSYSSIIRIAKFNKCDEKLFNWRLLKNASINAGTEIKKVPCPRYQTKSLYSHEAWRLAYPAFNLPETTTLKIVTSQSLAV
jgi:prophage antirepressor-like protein